MLQLRLFNLSVRDLVDTGTNSGFTKDPQDPCLKITVGKVSFSTERYSSKFDISMHLFHVYVIYHKGKLMLVLKLHGRKHLSNLKI